MCMSVYFLFYICDMINICIHIQCITKFNPLKQCIFYISECPNDTITARRVWWLPSMLSMGDDLASARLRQSSTYQGKLSDRVNDLTKPGFGPPRMLSDEEETILVKYCLFMASMGFPLTREILRCYIREMVRRSDAQTLFNMDKGPSNQWYRKFFARHPEVTQETKEARTVKKSHVDRSDTDPIFRSTSTTVDENAIVDSCDETGWTGKESSKPTVIGPKGKHVYQQQVTSSGHTTAHLCVSASGKFLPSMIVFEKALPQREYRDGVLGKWLVASSESGFMDGELFTSWFKNLFLPNCGKQRPVLLVMDIHDSHISIDVIELARANQVILLGLPPHTTHLQPLDVAIIGQVKNRFSSLATKLGFVNNNLVIGKAKFPVELSHAIDQITPAVIRGAFRKSGIHAIDMSVIDSQLTPSLFSASASNSAVVASTTAAASTSAAVSTSAAALISATASTTAAASVSTTAATLTTVAASTTVVASTTAAALTTVAAPASTTVTAARSPLQATAATLAVRGWEAIHWSCRVLYQGHL
jgi:hypothetical protein